MGMILTWCILVICWYVVSSTEGFEDKVPPPLCDVHSNAQRGYHTPPDLLPSPPSDSGWLYPSEDEIKYWYEKAHTKCQRSAQDKKSAAPVNIPPYYIDNSKYSLAGQQICRGRDTLFDMTGQTVWPFGPITSGCQTYSKCWFGLLSCGDFNQKRVIDSTYPQIVKEMKYVNASIPVPEANTMQWSMRSLVVQLRLLGPEIVVPEQRLVSLAGNVDVIIAQYHLTIPNEKYQLEARLFEFYPAALLPWSKIDWDTMAYQNVASVFLGANEDRCKPWTKCTVPSLCCGCDEKSFVSNTPMIVVVKDQKQRCQAELAKTPTLPLCRVEKHGSNPAGRWLQSTHEYFSSRCEVHHAYSIQHMKTHTESDILTKVTTHQPSANHTFTDSSWFEASGNPCIHAGASENEELGTSHWFFAPYQCKYHFYPRHQLHQCLQDTGITHMHFQGDSMSRELFGMVSKYLGVAQIAEGRLKEMTNDMKMKEIKFHSGNVLLSEGK